MKFSSFCRARADGEDLEKVFVLAGAEEGEDINENTVQIYFKDIVQGMRFLLARMNLHQRDRMEVGIPVIMIKRNDLELILFCLRKKLRHGIIYGLLKHLCCRCSL